MATRARGIGGMEWRETGMKIASKDRKSAMVVGMEYAPY